MSGSCCDAFERDRPVDVHIGVGAQHAASFIALHQPQFGQHLHIFMHTLDVAANSPGQFRHR